MPQELNGVTREFGSNGASRWAKFTHKNGLICAVNQWSNAAASPIVMASCEISWWGASAGGASIAEAELQAEALRQAIELARKWEADAGKPYNKVLQGE